MIAARAKQPALLIFNPRAGKLSVDSRDEVAVRLGERFSLDVVSTTSRRHAIELSRSAAADGLPLVLAFGGDGHVNEVVNGIAGTGSALGVIPGGTMNVFARSLGIPRRAQEAVDRLLSLDLGRARRVDLGLMDEHYFTFAAGCGFDAEAARLVESDLPKKRLFGEPFFYWSALRVLAGTYRARKPRMTVHASGDHVDVAMAIACNAGPYAYLLGLPVRLLPDGATGEGLDVVALSRLRLTELPWYAWRAMAGGSISRHRDAVSWQEVDELSITADEPFERHVDGETIAACDRVTFRTAPKSLTVLA